jgi:hypothetical protein
MCPLLTERNVSFIKESSIEERNVSFIKERNVSFIEERKILLFIKGSTHLLLIPDWPNHFLLPPIKIILLEALPSLSLLLRLLEWKLPHRRKVSS